MPQPAVKQAVLFLLSVRPRGRHFSFEFIAILQVFAVFSSFAAPICSLGFEPAPQRISGSSLILIRYCLVSHNLQRWQFRYPSRPAAGGGGFFREFRFPGTAVPSVPPYRHSHLFGFLCGHRIASHRRRGSSEKGVAPLRGRPESPRRIFMKTNYEGGRSNLGRGVARAGEGGSSSWGGG